MTEAASTVTDVIGDLMNLDTKSKTTKRPKRRATNAIPGTMVVAPTFLSSDQVAKYLNLASRLMENWRWRKVGLKYVKVGNRVRYDMIDLKYFVSS